MLSKKELILFSGGIDSAVLLKWLLINTTTDFIVTYINMGVNKQMQARNKIQNERVNTLIPLFKKIRDFEFIEIDFNIYQDKEFKAYDDQTALYLVSFLSAMHLNSSVWLGHFSYCSYHHYEWNNKIDSLFYNETLKHYLNAYNNALSIETEENLPLLKLNLPSKIYKGKELDSFPNKKAAFDYLNQDMKKLIRSCLHPNKILCGECYKCQQYIKFKII